MKKNFILVLVHVSIVFVNGISIGIGLCVSHWQVLLALVSAIFAADGAMRHNAMYIEDYVKELETWRKEQGK